MNPDPERPGGLAWTRRSGGRLTGAERRRLLAEIAKGQAENLIGRAKLALGRLPAGARDVDVRAFEPPDSRLARDAEEACAEQPDGPLGCYVQWGAMVDGAGLRIWDIAPANVQEVVRRHPRGSGFKGELASMMRAEAAAVPGGRFSLLVRCGVPLAIRLAPFDD